jgi:MHS family shikimate/dehydroshikimate transporter-like MFS transporter
MAVAEDFSTAQLPDAAAGLRRILWSSVIGTAVEWYDFLIYGAATALVFNKIFFAAGDPALATIAAFGTYAVGFLARPLGAAIFGHFGDRVGRKAMLAITIIVMGLGTFLIGLLPTYQQIGVAAPVLLVVLRFLQGIGLGGEWGGAVLMVVENAPVHKRGLLGSMVQVGNPIGNLAAIGMFALVSQLPDAEFLAWGWRVPFLISILLVGVGLWIRLRMEETPAFRQIKAKNEVAKMPIVDIFKYHRRPFFTAVCLKISEISLRQHRRRLHHVVCDLASWPIARTGAERRLPLIAGRAVLDSAVRMAVGQARPQDDVFCQLPVLGPVRIPDVLAARHPRPHHRDPDHRGRDQFWPDGDVRYRRALVF